MKNIGLVIFCIFAFSSFRTVQEPRKIFANAKGSSLTYHMEHPLHKWDASAKSFKCVITYNDATKKINSVAVVAKVGQFDSGNASRDSHAIEVLEALKFPDVTFVSNDVKQEGEQLIINGKLTFHGVSKALQVKATRKDSETFFTVSGKFIAKISEHNIENPTLMGLKTDDDIPINFMMKFDL